MFQLAKVPIPSYEAYHLTAGSTYLFRVTPHNRWGWGESQMTHTPLRLGLPLKQPEIRFPLPDQLRTIPGVDVELCAQVNHFISEFFIKKTYIHFSTKNI